MSIYWLYCHYQTSTDQLSRSIHLYWTLKAPTFNDKHLCHNQLQDEWYIFVMPCNPCNTWQSFKLQRLVASMLVFHDMKARFAPDRPEVHRDMAGRMGNLLSQHSLVQTEEISKDLPCSWTRTIRPFRTLPLPHPIPLGTQCLFGCWAPLQSVRSNTPYQ